MSIHLMRYEELKVFCEAAYQGFGFSLSQSELITDVLLLADLYGIDSHGTNRIVMYHEQIQAGFIDNQAIPEIVMETQVSAVVDGKRGMGQLVANFATDLAIQKAKKSGIGLVTVRNSNHYGIAGYYSLRVTKEGLIGISMTNSKVSVTPTFGKQPMMGTNPFAFSFPAQPQPFNFDVATSVVSVGKVEVYNKLGKELPLGWGMNSDGVDDIDAARVLQDVMDGKSGMHPLGGGTEEFGGHKGYGFSMVVEIFSSILSMGTTSNKTEQDGTAGICHFFAAIDPKIFGDPGAISHHLEEYLNEIRNSDKAVGQGRIFTHGEKEVESYNNRIQTGIPVNEKTILEMKAVAKDLGMDFYEYFPGLANEV